MAAHRIVRSLAALVALAATLAPLRAQDTGSPEPAKQGEPPEPAPPPLAGMDDLRRQMTELFHQVESKLQEIDRLLYDAGAGGDLDGPLEDAGIDRLLRDARERSATVQQGIDRILELARRQRQQQSSSMGGGQGEPSGESPLDRERGGTQQRERRPEGRAPGQPEPSEPQPSGDPQSPRDSREDPEPRPGSRPPKDPTGAPSRPIDEREKWGELPEQVRDVFRVQGGGDLPPRYRDFIDSYYRRMSKRP